MVKARYRAVIETPHSYSIPVGVGEHERYSEERARYKNAQEKIIELFDREGIYVTNFGYNFRSGTFSRIILYHLDSATALILAKESTGAHEPPGYMKIRLASDSKSVSGLEERILSLDSLFELKPIEGDNENDW